MTAPAPREKRNNSPIAFVSNAYGQDLFGPNGAFELKNYEYLYADLQGTLTITGGTTSGTPVFYNPKTLIKSIEVKITGSGLPDSFIELPLCDLEFLNYIVERDKEERPPNETPITSGDVGVYTFRGLYRIPFAQNDMPNPYKFFFNASRFTQTNIRVKFGTVEDLVKGGDRAKAISNCSVSFWMDDYSYEPEFDAAADLMFAQRVQIREIALGGVGSQKNFDIEIIRTPSFLRGVWLYQFQRDGNGVETPTDQLILDTDQVMLHVNDGDRKYEYTWEQLRDRMRRYYRMNEVPFGYAFLDISPRGDEGILSKFNMLNFNTIKVRIDNENLPNSVLRVGAFKYTKQ